MGGGAFAAMGSKPLNEVAFALCAAPVVLIDRRDEVFQAAIASVILSDEEAAGLAAQGHAGRRAELSERRRALRLFASLHLSCASERVPLSRGPSGEPVLEGGPFVSLSSRGRFIALSCFDVPHGLDLESFTPASDAPFAALHPEEAKFARSAKPDQVAALWAAKEAHWKAFAMPVSRDPKDFCVMLFGDDRFTVRDSSYGYSSGVLRIFQEQKLVLALVLRDKVL
jgi:phosphopantetheinyl transferase